MIKIRKAKKDDANEIGYVHYHSWMETYKGLIDDEFLQTRSEHKSVEFFQKNQCQNIYVALVDHQIVGFCGYGQLRDSDSSELWGEIQGIYILKQFQGLSIGKQLIKKTIAELKKEGYQKIFLWVLDTNLKAIGFYEKIGFVDDGTRKEVCFNKPIIERRYVYIKL